MSIYLPHYLAATCTSNGNSGLISSSGLPQTCANNTTLNHVFLIFFTIIGAVAFLFLVIGAFRYITAGSSPENVQKAKSQIQNSLVGLVITGAAAAIVNFAIDRLK